MTDAPTDNKPSNGQEGQEDVVAVIKTLVANRWRGYAEDHQLRAACERLTLTQARELARYALTQIDLNRSAGEAGGRTLETALTSLLGDLVGLYPELLHGSYDELLTRSIYWPGYLYLDADPPTRDELIVRCLASSGDLYTFTHLLTALAWIGDETVQALFLRWRAAPPVAEGALTYPLQDYTLLAGWELTPEGQRRNLYHNTSYALIPAQEAPPTTNPGPVAVIEPFTAAEALPDASVTCPQCGCELITLFSFDLRDPRLAFLGLAGERLRILTCNYCVRFGDILADFDLSGHAAWSAENTVVQTVFEGYKYGIETLPEHRLVLGTQRSTPYVGATVGGSQIGGVPQWVQNPEYKHCPRCQKRMVCVGQLETTAVAPDDSGTVTALICTQCHLVATTYDRD